MTIVATALAARSLGVMLDSTLPVNEEIGYSVGAAQTAVLGVKLRLPVAIVLADENVAIPEAGIGAAGVNGASSC
jgi:hypothetical protein